jgi:hypothetical protein
VLCRAQRYGLLQKPPGDVAAHILTAMYLWVQIKIVQSGILKKYR